MSRLTLLAAVVCSFVLFFGPLAPSVTAQDLPRPVIGVEAGWVGFADDGIVNEGMIGAAGRWPITPRLGIGPEVLYVDGRHHSHLIVTGNLTYDLLPPADRQSRRATPFVVAGGGMFHTRESLVTGTFTSTEGAFTAGGGVRALASDRVAAGVDVRVGWELHLRVNGFVGVRLGR